MQHHAQAVGVRRDAVGDVDAVLVLPLALARRLLLGAAQAEEGGSCSTPLHRFCDSMSSIKNEIDKVMSGEFSSEDNPLRGSPHTSLEVSSDSWNHEYSRETAAYPKSWLKTNKFWPSVGRVDNTHGDRNLICSCLDVKAYSENNDG